MAGNARNKKGTHEQKGGKKVKGKRWSKKNGSKRTSRELKPALSPSPLFLPLLPPISPSSLAILGDKVWHYCNLPFFLLVFFNTSLFQLPGVKPKAWMGIPMET